jgi:hypothetical protein
MDGLGFTVAPASTADLASGLARLLVVRLAVASMAGAGFMVVATSTVEAASTGVDAGEFHL